MATDAKERLQQQKGQELSQAPAPGLKMMRGKCYPSLFY